MQIANPKLLDRQIETNKRTSKVCALFLSCFSLSAGSSKHCHMHENKNHTMIIFILMHPIRKVLFENTLHYACMHTLVKVLCQLIEVETKRE